jgi:hypothetical protein
MERDLSEDDQLAVGRPLTSGAAADGKPTGWSATASCSI